MEEQVFKEKFNNFDPKMIEHSNKPLQTIHAYLFNTISHQIVRGNNEVQVRLNYINVLLNYYDKMDEAFFMKELLSAISQIYYYQPFCDGNGRTLVVYLKYVFYRISKDYNHQIDVDKVHYRKLISMLYYEDEQADEENINNGLAVLKQMKAI